ncbi:MAG: GNAT family N-acetyltransferase [Erysipelotrichaceae bacterium]|nr:GNAT family N-acetyltransferase [Erysipelotrichaceae bacterium]
MTTLDKSYAYEELIMVHDGSKIQESALPSGYRLAENVLDYGSAWAELMFGHGMFFSLQEAREYWQKMESQDPELLKSHFYFAVDETGQLAAACGLWPGNHLGSQRMRLHYVAAAEPHQKKGLARCLVSHAVYIGRQEQKEPLYLSTQAQSWPAIVLYRQLGFVPWTGKTDRKSAEQNRQAWKRARTLVWQKEGMQI